MNKYTGAKNFSFNPGYYVFNSPITASPVIYGDSLFISGHDGYLYALNDQKLESPGSIFLYYVFAIIIVLLIALYLVIRFIKNNKKKAKKNKLVNKNKVSDDKIEAEVIDKENQEKL